MVLADPGDDKLVKEVKENAKEEAKVAVREGVEEAKVVVAAEEKQK
ncbi:MAG: hypothetical protein Q7S66_04985 [bacterium]|nr:hypothetical protein [bacterium]